MMQEIVVIICVIFGVDARHAELFKRGSKLCGTFNQTGSCPFHNTKYRAYVNDTLRLFLERDSWVLAAAASNAKDAPPPAKTCVTIRATDTKKHSECIFNSYNHTPHMARRVRIVGYDEEDDMQVHSVGAIHNWPLDDFHKEDYNEYFFSKHFLHLNTVIQSTTCWNPVTMKFDPYRFIITNPFYRVLTTNVLHGAQFLLLIGVNARAPTPEIHLALLADRVPMPSDLGYAIHILEVSRRRDAVFCMIAYPEYMPPLTFRCAQGYKPPT